MITNEQGASASRLFTILNLSLVAQVIVLNNHEKENCLETLPLFTPQATVLSRMTRQKRSEYLVQEHTVVYLPENRSLITPVPRMVTFTTE